MTSVCVDIQCFPRSLEHCLPLTVASACLPKAYLGAEAESCRIRRIRIEETPNLRSICASVGAVFLDGCGFVSQVMGSRTVRVLGEVDELVEACSAKEQ